VRRAPELELVAAFGHAAAIAWDGDWSGVDVAVVDAADERAAGDQFPGVGVVRHIRATAADDDDDDVDADDDRPRPTVVVVTGHYLHDGLRHRMADADADFFFLRSDLRSPADLVDVIVHPERYRRGVGPVADVEAVRALGLDRGVDVEGFVAYVEEEGLGPELDPTAARPDPRSRRWLRYRQAMADAGAIPPVNITTGDRPLDQDVPSIRQLSRLWTWAARIRRPSE
jgi:GNAT superfamily N-acetyltransferase